MKNKTTKILLIISLIILGLGIICWFGADSLINETDNVTYLFSIFGMMALKLLVACITGGLISLIWLIYGIIILLKKIKTGQFKYKNLLIIVISFIIIIILFNVLSSLLNKNYTGFRKNKYDYAITYQDGVNIYNIYKTGNKIEVYADEQVICIKAPCPTVKSNRKINFSDDNMVIVNDFIDSFFGYHEYKTIQIYRENLNEKQNNILDSIIYNDESLLNKENAEIFGKYTIITDMRWITMQNDGGSHNSIYYEIDLDNKTIIKIEEAYHANLGGTPTTEKSIFYTKKMDDSLINETKKLIEEIINKEDINSSNNYHSFTIESSNIKKDIYNFDTIKNINKLLTKFDDYNKELVFSLESRMLKCPSPTLYVYNDGTYEYYYTHSSNNKELIPKKGTYNYDTNLILNNIANYEVDTTSSYALTDNGNKLHILADYKPLEDFLTSIDINIHTCTVEQN